VINDYGRPYEGGFNSYSGASGYATAGRFTLYVRGEFETAPSANGYSSALSQVLSDIDLTTYANPAGIPYSQATIPMGPIATTTKGRFMEAYVSAHVLNHEISFGKQDDWLGPGLGGGMAYSNNAENIYSFRINRVEPLEVPLLSRITGPLRYEFLIGKLRGHTYMPNPANPGGADPTQPNVINPGDPLVHLEKVSFRPTVNLEFGFERTAIWGGEGHGPITLHSFLKSFFSTASPSGYGKYGRDDPGARFGAFDFSYRLPLSGIGLRSIPTQKCMTTSPQLTLRVALPGDPESISPMSHASPSWTCASKRPLPTRPVRMERANTDASCTTK
jgi:hypothetical protein